MRHRDIPPVRDGAVKDHRLHIPLFFKTFESEHLFGAAHFVVA
jgi:hypothetical protein